MGGGRRDRLPQILETARDVQTGPGGPGHHLVDEGEVRFAGVVAAQQADETPQATCSGWSVSAPTRYSTIR